MEYTISDISTLRMYMYLWTSFITLFFLAICVFSIVKVPFDLKLGKQTDVLIRRIIFFSGLTTSVVTVFFFQLNYVIENFKSRILDEDMVVVIQALGKAIPFNLIASVVTFLMFYLLLAMGSKRWVGYKPYSVLKSNNKWFGII